MRMLDLFSGIGGFSLAGEWAGFETAMFCEIDPFCRAVLAHHWPEVPIHDDIKTLTGDAVGSVDLITGGFPCQPFSVAGKRRGQEDDRHLWPEMARLIGECRPRWVLGENTPGIIGLALDDCLADLESLGYEAWPVVLPACGVGAWHRRERVWIVAHRDGERRQKQRLAVADGTQSDCAEHVGASHPDSQGGGVRRGGSPGEAGFASQFCEDVPHSPGLFRPEVIGQQSVRNLRCDGSEWIAANSAVITEREQADETNTVAVGRDTWEVPRCGDWWSTEPGVCGVAHGVPRRVDRLRALGNAIVPQVAYEIMRLMR